MEGMLRHWVINTSLGVLTPTWSVDETDGGDSCTLIQTVPPQRVDYSDKGLVDESS